MIEDKDKRQYRRIRRRISICVMALFVFCALICIRVFWLQTVRGAAMAQRADNQTEEDRKLQSPRGTILDRDGRVLAISEMSKSLYADPTMMDRSPAEMAKLLAPYLRMKEPEIQ